MLFMETVAINCENSKKRVNTLSGQSAEILYIKLDGRYSDRRALKDWSPGTSDSPRIFY
jgi:hypothetical protein